MRTISLIPSYNPNNEFVPIVIEELNKFSDVILFTTEKHKLNVFKTIYFDKSIGRDLVYKPREWVVGNINQNWDYVLYNEDDILIPEVSFNNVLKLYTTLHSQFIPGFIRYEFDNRDNSKRYFDMNPVHAVHRGAYGSIKEKWENHQIWEPWNLHSGNWLFSKSDVKQMIQNKRFESTFTQYNFRYGNCDQLESAASVLYFNYIKVFPYNFESVECLHLPKKYIYFVDDNPTTEVLNLKLKNELFKNK